jgi:hypothetical protein
MPLSNNRLCLKKSLFSKKKEGKAIKEIKVILILLKGAR